MDQLTMSLGMSESERAAPAAPRAATQESLRRRLERLLATMKAAEGSLWPEESDVRLWTKLFETTAERLPGDEARLWTQAFYAELHRMSQADDLEPA